MSEPERAQSVGFADQKILEAFHKLEFGTFEDRQLRLIIADAIKTLKQNPEAGIKVLRPLWPRTYIQSYGINNLRKLDLNDGWRLLYTLKGSRVEVVSVILEWMNHKQYERRFGYKNK
jgi:Txe/YoeB family toxin of Txe-Axe toxin-antitoxin module